MTVDEVRAFSRAEPFRPFRVHGADGRAWEVFWPDECLVLPARVLVPLTRRPDGVPVTAQQLAMAEIVRVEAIGGTAQHEVAVPTESEPG